MGVNISGFWAGAYQYDVPGMAPVSFDAELTQEGFVLSGMITEPNTFDPRGGPLLSALVKGSIIERHLSFDKIYTGSGSAKHTVYYRGNLETSGHLITGVWKVAGYTGTFSMERDGPPVAVKYQVANDRKPVKIGS